MIKKPATAKLVTIVAVLAVATAAAAALATKYHSASRVATLAAAPPPPVSVVAASVQSHDVPIYLRGVGTVIAFNNVIVRSQITGQLVKIAFKQGQAVKKGDLLGEIDPVRTKRNSIRRSPIVTAIRPTWRTPRSTSIDIRSLLSKNRLPRRSRIPRRQSLTSSLP